MEVGMAFFSAHAEMAVGVLFLVLAVFLVCAILEATEFVSVLSRKPSQSCFSPDKTDVDTGVVIPAAELTT